MINEQSITWIKEHQLDEAINVRQQLMNWEITKKQYDKILFNL